MTTIALLGIRERFNEPSVTFPPEMLGDDLLPGVLPYIIQCILLPVEILHVDGNEYGQRDADSYRVNEIAAQLLIEDAPSKDQ